MNQTQAPIVKQIWETLEEDERVLACWLEGSLAREEEDDYSDINLWVAVKDKDFEEFVEDREAFAAQLGPVLSILYPNIMDPDDDLDSFRILLEGKPTTLAVEVNVQKRSRSFRFTKDSAAEHFKVIFDKADIVKVRPFNPKRVEEYVYEVFEDLSVRFWHEAPMVSKALARNDLIEAVDLYMKRLEDLVTVYRILHAPEKVDWGFKDIEYDLPEPAVKTVYTLLPRSASNALARQYPKLVKAFEKAAREAGKRLKIDNPTELIQHMSKDL